jgi:hypothetical protein
LEVSDRADVIVTTSLAEDEVCAKLNKWLDENIDDFAWSDNSRFVEVIGTSQRVLVASFKWFMCDAWVAFAKWLRAQEWRFPENVGAMYNCDGDEYKVDSFGVVE